MIAGYGLFPSIFNLVCIKDGEIDKDERNESKSFLNALDEAMVEVENFKKMNIILNSVLLAVLILIIFYS